MWAYAFQPVLCRVVTDLLYSDLRGSGATLHSTGENAYALIRLVLLCLALVRMHMLSSDWCYYEHWWECIHSHQTGATMSTGENAYALIWLVLLSTGENAYALIRLVLLCIALVRRHTFSSDWCYSVKHWWECICSHQTGAGTLV